jgi:3-deoxy-manno-octulosonate cytidylyltransferase (CMP-KDO synthetase)
MIKATGIIPARYASTRFPGKPLIDLAGKSMLQRVYERCKQSKSLSRIIIATDDDRIVKHAQSFGAEVCLTSDAHPSGTDRCAEVAALMDLDSEVIVNIQGDEPLINPMQIDILVDCFKDSKTQIATLVKKIEHNEVLFNVNTPKVLLDTDQFAIYFSRECIPHIRNLDKHEWLDRHTFYQHIGIYAYQKKVLAEITKLAPSSLEKAESLEQLRWIENQYKIKTALTREETFAIDTPEDIARVLQKISAMQL